MAFGAQNGSEFVSRVTLISGKREVLREGTIPREVPGRNLLLYAVVDRHGIFARHLRERGPAEPEQKLVGDFISSGIAVRSVHRRLFFTARDAAGNPRAFAFYSFDSKKTVDLAPAPKDLANGFAISPDRSNLRQPNRTTPI